MPAPLYYQLHATPFLKAGLFPWKFDFAGSPGRQGKAKATTLYLGGKDPLRKASNDAEKAQSEFNIAEQANAAAKAAYTNAGCDGANEDLGRVVVTGASSDCVALLAAMQSTEATEATKAAAAQFAQTKLEKMGADGTRMPSVH